MSEREPKRRKRQLSESQFRLALHHAAKSANGNTEVLSIINEMLKDIERYQKMDCRIIYWEQDGNLWLEPVVKKEIGFRRYGKRGRV